jgi:hypothetical protein
MGGGVGGRGKLQHGWTESELLLLKPKTLRLKKGLESGWLCGSKSTLTVHSKTHNSAAKFLLLPVCMPSACCCCCCCFAVTVILPPPSASSFPFSVVLFFVCFGFLHFFILV